LFVLCVCFSELNIFQGNVRSLPEAVSDNCRAAIPEGCSLQFRANVVQFSGNLNAMFYGIVAFGFYEG
jgi:hypothetical protein